MQYIIVSGYDMLDDTQSISAILLFIKIYSWWYITVVMNISRDLFCTYICLSKLVIVEVASKIGRIMSVD